MQPEPEPFAVDLSNEGIFLWHRKPGRKWEFLGSVPLNSGNLRQGLEALKTTAQSVAAVSYNAVVRIPTAEVQTLTVAHDPQADTSWEKRIVSALEAVAGAPVNTLVFDIDRGDGTSDISVAWTTVEVIKQAQIFVHLIGFSPTRYTTDLDVLTFPRNPSFQLIDPEAVLQNIVPEIPVSEYQQTPEEQAPEAPMSDLPNAEISTPPKRSSGFGWFVALFLILAVLLAGIYYWPRLKLQYVSQIYPRIDQPFIASVKILPQISLKRVNNLIVKG